MVEYLPRNSHDSTIQEPQDLLFSSQYLEQCIVSGSEYYAAYHNHISISLLTLGLISLGISYCAVLAKSDCNVPDNSSHNTKDSFLLDDNMV